MFARCLRSRDVFCNATAVRSSSKGRPGNVVNQDKAEVSRRPGTRDMFCSTKAVKSSSKDRPGNAAVQDTAEVRLRSGTPSPPPPMGSGVDKEDTRSSSRKKKRMKKIEGITCFSPDLNFHHQTSGSFEVQEAELIELLTVHRKVEAKELELRKHLMDVSEELLSKEDSLMAQLDELREKKRSCITTLGEVLKRIDTCRAHLEANEAELAAVRHLKCQEEATSSRAVEEELKLQCADAVEILEIEKEKSLCQICMNRSRDALVLPCMHFLYCSDCLQKHQTARNDCPTCRGPITALLLCKLDPN